MMFILHLPTSRTWGLPDAAHCPVAMLVCADTWFALPLRWLWAVEQGWLCDKAGGS